MPITPKITQPASVNPPAKSSSFVPLGAPDNLLKTIKTLQINDLRGFCFFEKVSKYAIIDKILVSYSRVSSKSGIDSPKMV